LSELLEWQDNSKALGKDLLRQVIGRLQAKDPVLAQGGMVSQQQELCCAHEPGTANYLAVIATAAAAAVLCTCFSQPLGPTVLSHFPCDAAQCPPGASVAAVPCGHTATHRRQQAHGNVLQL